MNIFFRETLPLLKKKEADACVHRVAADAPATLHHYRAIIFEWVVDCAVHFRLDHVILDFIFTVFDMFLANNPSFCERMIAEPDSELQTTASAAILLGCKVWIDVDIPPSELSYLTDHTCTRKNIVATEKLLIMMLGFRVFSLPSVAEVIGVVGNESRLSRRQQRVLLRLHTHLYYQDAAGYGTLSISQQCFFLFSRFCPVRVPFQELYPSLDTLPPLPKVESLLSLPTNAKDFLIHPIHPPY